jgi:hypothetical protein
MRRVVVLVTALPDVVASSLSEAGFRVFLNDPATPGTLLPGAHYGAGVDAVGGPKLAVADMDGDARPDVVIADDSLLAYYPQSAANPGSFLAGRTIGAGFSGTEIVVADLDGDGRRDFAVSGFDMDSSYHIYETMVTIYQAGQGFAVAPQEVVALTANSLQTGSYLV